MSSSDRETVIRLRGELDLETARAARDEIVAALEPDLRMVVDLADVAFMDSSGLGALVFALREAKAVGATLVVDNPQPWVGKLFEAAGVAQLFGLATSDHSAPSTALAGAASDDDSLADVRALLRGYENLLRWGDLTPEQVTIALAGTAVADTTDDLALAQRVRAALASLGEMPADSSDD